MARGGQSALKDCFDTTDWGIFKEAATYNNHTDIEEYTEAVTAYTVHSINEYTE